jgi:hypothetical protein
MKLLHSFTQSLQLQSAIVTLMSQTAKSAPEALKFGVRSAAIAALESYYHARSS